MREPQVILEALSQTQYHLDQENSFYISTKVGKIKLFKVTSCLDRLDVT